MCVCVCVVCVCVSKWANICVPVMYTYLLTHVSMCVQTHMGTVQWMRASVTKSLGMCCFKPHHYTWLGWWELYNESVYVVAATV